MRAEPETAKNHTVRIVSTDKDFKVVKNARVSVAHGANYTEWNTTSASDMFDYVGSLEYVSNDDIQGTNLPISMTVYEVTSTGKVALDEATANAVLQGAQGIWADMEIQVSFKIDYQHAGYQYIGWADTAYADGKDDRDQRVVSVKIEGWDESTDKATGKYSEVKYVVNDDKGLKSLVEGLAEYDWYYSVDEDVYELVFYVKGDTVTANWEKNPESKYVNGTPAADNELDTNGDGKISCDEYYKTTGLVWSDEKNACVVESNGAVVVTIPNTATK